MPEPVGIALGTKHIFAIAGALIGSCFLSIKFFIKYFLNRELKRIDKTETDIEKLKQSKWSHLNEALEMKTAVLNNKLDRQNESIKQQNENIQLMNGRIDDIFKLLSQLKS